jgi:uroporphyrinogen-III synthase
MLQKNWRMKMTTKNNAIDLHGLRVLVTRPKPMGEILCQHINAGGGEAIYFPTIDISPPANPSVYRMQLKKLDHLDWLIFLSPQAVYSTSHLIHLDWPNFPPAVKIAAVGGGTAKALQLADLRLDVFPKEQWSSEGLLSLPEFSQIKGKKIALMRGDGGREYLRQSLQLRGAIVSEIMVYRRVKPLTDPTPYCNMLRDHLINCVVATSGEGLRNLLELCVSVAENLFEVPLVVISPRLQDIARTWGFKKILLAKNPSHNAIIDTLSATSYPTR